MPQWHNCPRAPEGEPVWQWRKRRRLMRRRIGRYLLKDYEFWFVVASQHLMAQGYGYGGEGDWKVSAMTAIMKAMSEGQTGGTAFMEDYTYNLEPDAKYSLGAHHTVLSYDVTAEQMKDWARMMDIEFVHITKDTTVEALERQLFLNDLAWKLK